MDDPMLAHELDKEEGHEPEPCEGCKHSKMLGRLQEFEPATGRWHWIPCDACNGTGVSDES